MSNFTDAQCTELNETIQRALRVWAESTTSQAQQAVQSARAEMRESQTQLMKVVEELDKKRQDIADILVAQDARQK